MKKIFLLATSALLLLAGCAKEVSGPSEEGGLQNVTFTASMAGDATRAAADNDGNAANVNRCIMEIYYDGSLFERKYAAVTSKVATFSTQLVSNRTYTVAFWADYVTAAASTPTTDELAQDLYYTTTADGGLQAISLKGTYAGNNDARDAFFHCSEYTIAQAGSAFNATLYRPFAQVNVITTDWDKSGKIESIKPETVDVTIQSPLTKFNALTGVASADANVTSLHYNAAIYTSPTSATDATLSMDYLFAAADKAVIDIAWKAQKTDNSDVSHSFSNIPYQRNYRTNIKGNLLTTTGQWNVTVDPIWGGEHSQIVEVKDIQSANAEIQANASSSTIDVKFSAEPNDSGVPTGQSTSTARAILTTPVAQGATLSIEVASETNALYIGDYEHDYDVTTMATSTTPQAATVNINVPSTGSIGTLVINAPSKTVYINGKQVSNVGQITNLDAITSDNTLVIEANQTVTNLTIRQGALEIHGTVEVATVDVVQGKNVFVRDCEGLSQSVYDVLEPYIDVANGYEGVQNGEKWDVKREYVAQIDDTKYYTLKAAIENAVSDDEILILKNCSLNSQTTISKNLSFDLDDKTISVNAASVRAIVLDDNAELSFKDGALNLTNESALGLFDVTSGKSLDLSNIAISGNTENQNGGNIKSCLIFNDGTASVNLDNCTGNTNWRIYRGQKAGSSLTVNGGTYTWLGYNVAFQDAGNAVYKDVSITVQGDESATYQCGIYVAGTASIENCIVSCPNSGKGVISVCSEGTATIDRGSYSGKIGVEILTSGGTAVIKNGTTVSGTSFALYADSRNSGSKYEGTDKTAEIIVNGGNVTGYLGLQHKGQIIVHGGNINGNVGGSTGDYVGEGNPLDIDGGKFSFDPSNFTVKSTTYTTCVKEGCTVDSTTESGKYIVVSGDPVAKIGSTNYYLFSAAAKAATQGCTITLLRDATLESDITLTGGSYASKYINIDGDYTLTIPSDVKMTVYNVNINSDLVLYGNIYSASSSLTNGALYTTRTVNMSGNTTVYGDVDSFYAHFGEENPNPASSVKAGDVKVNGNIKQGYFTCESLLCTGTISSSGTSSTVYCYYVIPQVTSASNGDYYMVAGADIQQYQALTSICADEYRMVPYSKTPSTSGSDQFQIKPATGYFSSILFTNQTTGWSNQGFTRAQNWASAGQTIVMEGDLSSDITISKAITLDLGGNTMSGNITVSGVVPTLQNGTITGTITGEYINGGNLIISE